jgi:hypothetical protein
MQYSSIGVSILVLGDKLLKRKEEGATVLMSRMVVCGGSTTNMDCGELLLFILT